MPTDFLDYAAYQLLLVDDQACNLRTLSDCLSQYGFKLLVAKRGAQALERAAGTSLILLDVLLPDMDGFEVCRRLKADPATADIPVIFMTALNDTADKVRGFDAGGVDYITKPFQPVEVLARITTQLRLRSTLRAEVLRPYVAALEARLAALEALVDAPDPVGLRERVAELAVEVARLREVVGQDRS